MKGRLDDVALLVSEGAKMESKDQVCSLFLFDVQTASSRFLCAMSLFSELHPYLCVLCVRWR
jgi:hypothetical protein